MYDTRWHSNFKECGPFDSESEWDPSWKIPIEFRMEDGSIKRTTLVYCKDANCFDYTEEDDGFVIDYDVYAIVAFRFTKTLDELKGNV